MEPKDTTQNEAFKGFTNTSCPFLPCHPGVKRAFNCLFCYCPLIGYECPGPYQTYTDRNGLTRKDCSACTLPHDGHEASWNFIQKWLEYPQPWSGQPQTNPPTPRPKPPGETEQAAAKAVAAAHRGPRHG